MPGAARRLAAPPARGHPQGRTATAPSRGATVPPAALPQLSPQRRRLPGRHSRWNRWSRARSPAPPRCPHLQPRAAPSSSAEPHSGPRAADSALGEKSFNVTRRVKKNNTTKPSGGFHRDRKRGPAQRRGAQKARRGRSGAALQRSLPSTSRSLHGRLSSSTTAEERCAAS